MSHPAHNKYIMSPIGLERLEHPHMFGVMCK